MKANSIINRYLFMELVPSFLISISFFTFIFLMAQLLKIINLIVNYGISIPVVFLMLIYLIPSSLIYVIPISVLITVLLTFLRLSSDNEIIALKSVGVSIYQIFIPVLIFCAIGFSMTVFMTMYGSPNGRFSLKKLSQNVIMSNIDIALKERVFNDNFEDVVLYINKVDFKENKLQDVFIEDKSNKGLVMTIVAPKGKIIRGTDTTASQFRLYNGIVNQVTIADRLVNTTKFDTYDFSLDVEKAGISKKEIKKGKNTSLTSELSQYLKEKEEKNDKDKRYYRALMEYYKRFSIPFSCFIFGLLALPLGVQSMSSGRSFGLLFGMLFFMLYYLILSIGSVFGETGAYPPIIGMWAPDIITGGIGLYIFIKVANEEPLLIDPVARFFKWIATKSSG
ncbi:MAG: LPS export ABC transporter permease LptF [Deltaproteobacteria bacterium]|nr:LPS export ABC transporter permease LptF [Deltaproteobacteria bacterium]MBW1846064.1 LPS export ABC transporter permease LptF [Deltaproteobacteria bacterium]MBW2181659.1 LPS export ABC transporter permease LptF [Deltaproteobacteria bacterium]